MSSRTRIRAIVGAIALAAAAVAAVIAWAGSPDEQPARPAGPRAGVPPLRLDAIVSNLDDWTSLRSAASLYTSGKRAQARAAFERILARDPGSLAAEIGVAMATWPHGTVPALGRLARAHPRGGAVWVHLGFALFWLRQDRAALSAWRTAERVDPDSPAAVLAETLLHPEMPPDLPLFVPAQPGPADIAAMPNPYDQLDALRARAGSDGTARAWIDYGVALQRAHRPVSAQEAYDRAVALAPADPEALTAAAVARFDKDDPSAAIGRMGPLSKRFPDAAVVRFHFGLCLLWLPGFVDRAREQLRLASTEEPESVWGREASDLLARLPAPESPPATTAR